MAVQVAKVNEIPPGGMKRVRAYDQDILLSNVDGTIYATSNRCGHTNASLVRGTLQGKIVTCPLHGAKFDVTTGKNILGPQMSMPPELREKLPQEFLAMMQKTAEIVAEIQVEPLKTFKVSVKGELVFLEGFP